MRGNITRRGKSSYRLKFDIGRDPATGARLTQLVTVRGTRRDAEAKLTELLGAVDKDSYVAPSKLTVAQLVRDRVGIWEASGDISPKTAERYRELVENQIVPFLGAKLVQKLKTIDVETWHTDLLTKGRKDGAGGVSSQTVKHAHRVLSKALRQAARHDLVIKNVAADEGAPRVEETEMVILTPEQVTSLPVLLSGDRFYCRAIVALFTGVRRGELAAFRRSNVDLDTKVLKVRGSIEEVKGSLRFKAAKTKSGRRDITLPDIVIDALRGHLRQMQEQRLALGLGRLPDDALLFAGENGGLINPDDLSAKWREVADRVGLKGIKLHALRHTHASQLIDAGVDIVSISKRLGHASPAITLRIYAHLFRKDNGKAAAAINAALSGASKA